MTVDGRRWRGVATDEMRRHNLGVVLERIHLADAISRSELADITGLNRSTIGALIAELVGLGLVVEDSVASTGSPGRPSAVARPEPSGAEVLAVELEVDYTAAAIVGLGGTIRRRVSASNPSPHASPGAVVEHLHDLAAPLLEGPAGGRLVGIGVAAAGLVRRHDGLIRVSPNRGWTGVPLGSMIAERFAIDRVRIANEADTAALAELRRGCARAASDVLLVSGAIGVGVGIVKDGQAFSGALGFAGEAGHAVVNPDGRRCRCGSTGCWETEVGQETLAQRAGVTSSDGHDGLAERVHARACAGDRRALEALAETGRWLGIGVGNLINIFNPDLVVFGGFYAPIFELLEPWILDRAEQVALAAPWHECAIRRSELGADARLVGASELVFADVIADPLALGPGPTHRRSSVGDDG